MQNYVLPLSPTTLCINTRKALSGLGDSANCRCHACLLDNAAGITGNNRCGTGGILWATVLLNILVNKLLINYYKEIYLKTFKTYFNKDMNNWNNDSDYHAFKVY